MNNIETEKINLVIENKGSGKLLDELTFNKDTLSFLRTIYNEYESFIENRTNKLDDIKFYKKIDSIVKKECNYCYKLSRDISIIITNMSNGVYYEPNIEEFDSDMIYVKFILNKDDYIELNPKSWIVYK